jgi:hypothetical protein
MSSDDLSLRILIEIREDVRATHLHVDQVEQKLGERIDRLEGRVDGLEARFETRFDAVERQIVESEIRTATAINDLAGTMRDVGDMFRDRFELRDRVTRCELDIDDLKHRVG